MTKAPAASVVGKLCCAAGVTAGTTGAADASKLLQECRYRLRFVVSGGSSDWDSPTNSTVVASGRAYKKARWLKPRLLMEAAACRLMREVGCFLRRANLKPADRIQHAISQRSRWRWGVGRLRQQCGCRWLLVGSVQCLDDLASAKSWHIGSRDPSQIFYPV